MIYKIVILYFLVISSLQAQVTAGQVINKIRNELNCPWNPITVDKIKAGSENIAVTGIATTFMATLEVLKKAHAAGCNMVITHEPTFYSHTDDLKTHEGEYIQEEKLKYIKDHNMVVWRFHDHQHAHKPDMIYEGVLEKMDWKKYATDNAYIYKFPSRSLESIVKDIEQKFKAKSVRVVGNPLATFTSSGLALGAAGSGAHFSLLKNPDCQLLIVGESNEWETVPYVQDAITLGQNRALIVMGHADSEEAGMEVCARWLKPFFPSIKIQFIEAGNPYWTTK